MKEIWRAALLIIFVLGQTLMVYGQGTGDIDKARKRQQKLLSSAYHNTRGGLANSYLKFEKSGKGRVAFLGGSITYNSGWRDSVCMYLTDRFPDTEFDFIAAGIPSMGTTPAAFRMERDVFKNGMVDLLFEEAAVNDATNGRSRLEQLRAMEGIVRHARIHNPYIDIVIMHFADPGKMKTYREALVPDVIINHEEVAEHYKIPTINLAKEVTDRIDAGEFTWEGDFKNLHPSPFGQGVYSRSIKVLLDDLWSEERRSAMLKAPAVVRGKIDAESYDNGYLLSIENIKTTPGWRIEQSWQPDDGLATRANYTDVPMLICESPESQLDFVFNGRAIGIAIAAGADAGIIEYRIDDSEWQQQDLFTRWSRSLHLPWYYTLATGLGSGEHKISLRMSEKRNSRSTGNVCRIRYIYINR